MFAPPPRRSQCRTARTHRAEGPESPPALIPPYGTNEIQLIPRTGTTEIQLIPPYRDHP